MTYLSKREQAWWNRKAVGDRTVKFNSEADQIAIALVRAITIPQIKRALGMHSEFYIKCKHQDPPWMKVYDLDHIRHLNPVDIRVMLFITNLGFSYEETASRLGITFQSAHDMCQRAWRLLTKQASYNERATRVCRPSINENVTLKAVS